jgi:hypothetical protein
MSYLLFIFKLGAERYGEEDVPHSVNIEGKCAGGVSRWARPRRGVTVKMIENFARKSGNTNDAAALVLDSRDYFCGAND